MLYDIPRFVSCDCYERQTRIVLEFSSSIIATNTVRLASHFQLAVKVMTSMIDDEENHCIGK